MISSIVENVNEKGIVESRNIYTYDDLGYLISQESEWDGDPMKKADGIVDYRRKTTYTYNEDNNLISQVFEEDGSSFRGFIGGADGVVDSRSINRYIYDQLGNKLAEIYEQDLKVDGTIDYISTTNFNYNELGLLISEIYEKDGALTWYGYITVRADGIINFRTKTLYSYDELGNLVSKFYERDGEDFAFGTGTSADSADGTIDEQKTTTYTYIYYTDDGSIIIRPLGYQDNKKDLKLSIADGFTGNLAKTMPQDPESLAPDATHHCLNAFSLNALSFEITNLAIGASTEVQIILPSHSNINDYLKLIDGNWQSFTFDGTTGAEFRDLNEDGTADLVLHLQDGGRGDGDGVANGVISDPGAPTTTVPGLTNINGVFIADTLADATLQARWLSSPLTGNYEFGWIPVDNAQGWIDGIAPDDENYAVVALARKNMIFSGNSVASHTALTRESLDDFTSSEYQHIGQLHNDTLQTGFNIFYLSENGQTTFSVNSNENFTHISDGQGYHELSFNDSQGQKVRFELVSSALITPGITGNQWTAKIELKRISDYADTLGIYPVDDLRGGLDTDGDEIIDLLTGDTGYAQMALQRAHLLPEFQTPEKGGSTQTTLELEAGRIFGLFIIPNASIADVLTQNPHNQNGENLPLAYFSFADANPDGFSHMIRLGSNNENIFGFEDVFGDLSDRDFNDLIVSISSEVI